MQFPTTVTGVTKNQVEDLVADERFQFVMSAWPNMTEQAQVVLVEVALLLQNLSDVKKQVCELVELHSD